MGVRHGQGDQKRLELLTPSEQPSVGQLPLILAAILSQTISKESNQPLWKTFSVKKRELESSSKPQDPFYTAHPSTVFRNVHLETPELTFDFEKVSYCTGHAELCALGCVLS